MAPRRAPELDPAHLPAGTVVGAWCVVKHQGQGSYGAVYRAVPAGQDTASQVALKLALHPWDPRFVHEVVLLSRVRHPSIPRLLDHGFWRHPSGAAYPSFAMEWVEGTRLYDWTREDNPSSRQVLRLLAQLARALEATHALGAVHRDVKGGNVLVRRTDRNQSPHSSLGMRGSIASSLRGIWRWCTSSSHPRPHHQRPRKEPSQRPRSPRRQEGHGRMSPPGCPGSEREPPECSCSSGPDKPCTRGWSRPSPRARRRWRQLPRMRARRPSGTPHSLPLWHPRMPPRAARQWPWTSLQSCSPGSAKWMRRANARSQTRSRSTVAAGWTLG